MAHLSNNHWTRLLLLAVAILLPRGGSAAQGSVQSSVVKHRKVGGRLPDATPLQLLTSIYAYYENDGGGEGLHFFGADAKRVFEPALAATILKVGREAMARDEIPGALDTDPFVGSQEPAMSNLRIVVLSETRTTARVRAAFDSGNIRVEILHELVKVGADWRIRDERSVWKGGANDDGVVVAHLRMRCHDPGSTSCGSGARADLLSGGRVRR